ncbi:hypothetical protein LRX75_16650 [Rhizobium sp. DKSPLA3]|uniref:BA14K family protein n=1 Tax=Rhizobium quercicola TaxID=2901226 RepID=A0A9X1T226_9HYPH|nr:hypothetical protein [Rhizobium quercicola]MCD7110664.1 hypothetical protein [Rhizobium quercicola]
MTKMTHMLGAAAVAVVLGLTSFTTASAAPVVPAPVQLTSDAQLAQYRDRDERPRWKKRYERRHDRRVERHESRRGYWRGHRGYREARRGYRRHSDGYYYAPEVFRLIIR